MDRYILYSRLHWRQWWRTPHAGTGRHSRHRQTTQHNESAYISNPIRPLVFQIRLTSHQFSSNWKIQALCQTRIQRNTDSSAFGLQYHRSRDNRSLSSVGQLFRVHFGQSGRQSWTQTPIAITFRIRCILCTKDWKSSAKFMVSVVLIFNT